MNKILFILLYSYPAISVSQNIGYIWGTHFPALIEPNVTCCFDYDNDGTLDDGLSDFLITLQSQSSNSFQQSINQAILDNSLVKAFDWQDFNINMPNHTLTFNYLMQLC